MLPAPRRHERNPYSAFMNDRMLIILARMRHSEAP
jgi:hypothetical protein